MKSIDVLGVSFQCLLKSDDVVSKVRDFLHSETPHFIVTPNPEILLKARGDFAYRDILNGADMRLPDGIGILWAATVLDFARKKKRSRCVLLFYALFALLTLVFYPPFCRRVISQKITGTDLMQRLCELNEPRMSVYLLGASEGVALKLAAILQTRNPHLKIAGFAVFGPSLSEEADIVSAIRSSKATVLFVAFGAPEQEKWIQQNLHKLPDLKLAMGVGGAFDYLSGSISRAPLWMRSLGLEWLYRLFRQPQRIRRIFRATVYFPFIVFQDAFKK